MFHNNYVRESSNKQLRLKEMGFFVHDIHGAYSAPAARYLTFELVHEGRPHANGSRVENLAAELAAIVRVANRLDRTLVLPPLRCPAGARWAYCNLCFFEVYSCLSSVTRKLKHPYKESSFFTHAFVPPAMVREDASNPIYDFSRNCSAGATYALCALRERARRGLHRGARAEHTVACAQGIFSCVVLSVFVRISLLLDMSQSTPGIVPFRS